MDDDVASRFDDFDKRFQTLEKRFDDVKWYFGGASAVFAVFISLFTLIANSNLNSEKSSLQQFKSDLRADLGKAESIPDIELLGVNGELLQGQEIPARIERTKEGYEQIVIEYAIRNRGAGNTGSMFLKVYSNTPILLNHTSFDEQDFKYEDYVNASSFDPNDIPGGNYSSDYNARIGINQHITPGKYPILFKVYFGKGKVARSQFVINVQYT